MRITKSLSGGTGQSAIELSLTAIERLYWLLLGFCKILIQRLFSLDNRYFALYSSFPSTGVERRWRWIPSLLAINSSGGCDEAAFQVHRSWGGALSVLNHSMAGCGAARRDQELRRRLMERLPIRAERPLPALRSPPRIPRAGQLIRERPIPTERIPHSRPDRDFSSEGRSERIRTALHSPFELVLDQVARIDVQMT